MTETPWTYTFCDMRTGEELAVLPLTRVDYTRTLGGVGALNAYLHLGEKARGLNPWRATRQRRTACYVEHTDTGGQTNVVWGGPVITRERADTSDGMILSAITWEGWLHRQYLLTDLDIWEVSLTSALQMLVHRAQLLTNVGMAVNLLNPPPFDVTANRLYLAREVKPILELLEGLSVDVGVPFEFRVDCYRDPVTRRFRLVLRADVPRVGRLYEDSQTTFAYPDGGLVHWKLVEDGTDASNVMPLLGSGSGNAQPFDVLYDIDAGLDELDSGFPSWMRDYRAQDTDDLDRVWAYAGEAMRAGQAAEYVFTDVRLRAADYLGRVDPGDDIALAIKHRALQEWPAEVTYLTRVLGEAVTVGDGGNNDRVSVTIGAATT